MGTAVSDQKIGAKGFGAFDLSIIAARISRTVSSGAARLMR
jgi:nucleoid DNA-binding protein